MNKLLSLKKPRKLQSKSPSMDAPSNQKTNIGELSHFSHREHNLIPFNTPYVFMCMVCKETGAGKRFICQTCGFADMHEFCALAPQSLHNHPFHLDHQLDFSLKLGGSQHTKCDICGKTAKGYSFRCDTCGFEMHPCCATMYPQMNFPIHPHVLFLSSCNGESTFLCQICRRKRSGQVYQCKACRYYLHAVCAKKFINGLGVVQLEKKSLIAKIASAALNLVFEGIGGLIEGIGEGIGESLVDSIGKGIRSCTSIKNK